METERTGKEREDVQEQNLKPIQAQEERVVAEETPHMELGRKHQWAAQKQNMTRKVTQRAAGSEDVTDLETRVALMRTATSL